MSYPPPNPDLYAINGYKFFRLNTQLTSDGDIYESAQGAQGFSIGPDSDISKVNIGYFDDQVDRFMNQLAISPGRPFPGVLLARNETVYVPSNRPGRILIWPDEIYNPTWEPDFVDITGRLDFEVPVLDVVQYFAPGGLDMTGGRNDKEYWYDFIAAPPAGVGVLNAWTVVIPFYGRRFASLTWQNDQAVDTHMIVIGLHYKPGSANTAAIQTPLRDTVVVAGDPNTEIILGSQDGTFDALAVEFYSEAGQINRAIQSTLRIRTSDREA